MSKTDGTSKIRDAHEGDVPAIVALYADDPLGRTREQAAEPLPASYWTAFEALRTDPRHRLVVVDDGEIAATLQLSFLPHLSAWAPSAPRSRPSELPHTVAVQGWDGPSSNGPSTRHASVAVGSSNSRRMSADRMPTGPTRRWVSLRLMSA